MYFTALLAIASAALSVIAMPSQPINKVGGIVTLAEIKAWAETMDPANLTIHGDPFSTLAPRSPDTALVIYCDMVVDTFCTGNCHIVSESGICWKAPNTQCLFATGNVQYCTGIDCFGDCADLPPCATPLNNGYCGTPGTNSIYLGWVP